MSSLDDQVREILNDLRTLKAEFNREFNQYADTVRAEIRELEEKLAESEEREKGLSIMLTCAQTGAETLARKYEEKVAELEQVTRERDAALAGWQRYAFDGESMCWTCKHCEGGMCTSHFAGEERECWEWRGVPQEEKP